MSNLILLLFSFELGFLPNNGWYDEGSKYKSYYDDAVYLNLDFETVVLEHLFVGGWVETGMVKSIEGKTFYPLQQTYQFRAGLRWQNIELGYSHVCGPHPVMTYPQFGLNDNLAPFEGAVDRLYIKVSNH